MSHKKFDKRPANAPFSVRLSEHDLHLLRKICEREHRTVADEIRHLISKELNHLGLEASTHEPGMAYVDAVKL